MTRYSSPPPELAAAIASSAARFNVPADLLAGIWQREAGGAFPNPFVNSAGYGGLFGTRNGLASTQAQADEAASVLAAGLQASGGDVAQALSYYNSGKLQGGYTSVPGETTFGNVARPRGSATTVALVTRPRPGQATDQLVGSWYQFLTPGGALSGLEGAWQTLSGGASDVFGLLKLFTWFSEPKTWLRIVEFLVGVALMAGSVRMLAQLLAGGKAQLSVPGAGAIKKAFPEAGLLTTAAGAAAGGRSRRTPGRRRRSTSTARRPPDELAAARARTESERTKEVRARRRRHLEQARELRRDREKRERAAYFRGAADAS